MHIDDMHRHIDDLFQRGRYAEVEAASRALLGKQRFFLWHLYLIAVLLRTGRRDEAERELDDLFSYKFNIADRAWPEIKAAFPEKFERHYVLDTMKPGFGIETGAHIHLRRRWGVPYPLAEHAAYGNTIDGVIAESVPQLPILPRERTRVTTFGSCFAANLAGRLKVAGIDATNLLIEESVNSPLANRAFLGGIADPASSPHVSRISATYGEDFAGRVRHQIGSAKVVVITLGVAPSFFHRKDGELVFLEDHRPLLAQGSVYMRTPTVGEIKAAVADVLRLVRTLNGAARMYVTISPVPLYGTVELSNALVADCVSKTTLRASLHELLQEGDWGDVHYWPAFEIVRWLGAHSTLPVFGADDGDSRHVSNWLVDMIVQRFSRHLFGEQGAVSPTANRWVS